MMPDVPPAIVLDVRHLPPPEPMEQVLDALNTLAHGQTLQVIIHREPFPLYDLLAARGYTWHTDPITDGRFHILITAASSA